MHKTFTAQAVRRNKELLAVVLILAAVVLAYFNALSNGFVFDDVTIIQINPLIRGWHNLPAIFTTGYWEPAGETGGLYRPLTIFSYMAEYSIGGINPWLYHLDNVLLHFLCCVFVYLIARKMTGSEPASIIAGLLFAVHPVHVEAVANTVGRAEILSSLFTLAGLYVFITTPKRLPWYVVSPLLMFMGLLSKETAIVLPVLVFVYILLFERDGRGRNIKSVALSLAPFAVAAVLYIAARFIALSSEEFPQGAAQVFIFTKPYWRMLVMFKVFIEYIRLAVFPNELYAYYMLRPPESFFNPWVFLFLGIVGSFAVASRWLIRNKRTHYFFAAWFIIALIPVSNIIPIGILMSERSMYLPSVSVCVLGGLLFTWAGGGLHTFNGHRAKASAAGLTALLVVLTGITHDRNKVWHDSISFDKELVRSYRNVISEFPESGLYYMHLSVPLKNLGNKDEAIACIKKAIELDPDSAGGYLELARIYTDDYDYNLAYPMVEKAASMTRDPSPEDDAIFALNFYKKGRRAEFRRYLSYLLSSDTGKDPQVIANISTHLCEMGMFDESEKYIKKAIELNPYVWQLHLNYAYLLKRNMDSNGTIAELDKVIDLNPDVPEAYYEKGVQNGAMEKYQDAVSNFEKAVSLKPDDPKYRYMLAVAYIGAGRDDDAARELTEALRLKPDYEDARDLLDKRPH